jgi:hypothetical protein
MKLHLSNSRYKNKVDIPDKVRHGASKEIGRNMVIKTLVGILFLSTLASACSTVPAVNRLSPAQRDRLDSIAILQGESSRPYRNLGAVRGSGCQKKVFDNTIPEDEALGNLKIQAASVNADAVMATECKSATIDFFTDCFTLITCTGEAILFLDR